MRRLHGNDLEKIEREVQLIHQIIEADNDGMASSWRDLFTWGPEGRKAYLGFALQEFQQASGINFITGYGIVFFFAIGIENPFLIQLGLYLAAMPAVWISQYTIEKFGRRPVMLLSGGLMACTSIIMGACGLATTKSYALEQTIVAMCYVFLVVFNLGWGPTVWVCVSVLVHFLLFVHPHTLHSRLTSQTFAIDQTSRMLFHNAHGLAYSSRLI
jgi:SP family sugar:H+ symporter-like MFS transporter